MEEEGAEERSVMTGVSQAVLMEQKNHLVLMETNLFVLMGLT